MKNFALLEISLPLWSCMSTEKFGYLFRSSKASENVEREKQTTSLTPVRFALLRRRERRVRNKRQNFLMSSLSLRSPRLRVRPVLILSCCCPCLSTSRKCNEPIKA